MKSDGDYRLCFDNSISRFSSKIVFFEVIIESEGDGEDDNEEFDDIFRGGDQGLREGAEKYDVAVNDIQVQ